MQLDVHGVLSHPDRAEALTRRELRDVLLLAAHDELAVTWSRYAPGERGPGPHVHREHTDAFYVLEGELVFGVGPEAAEVVQAPAGTLVAVPANVVHTFANESGAEARFLNFHAPDCGFAASMRARRDGGDPAFDSFDPPADGGLPAAEAVVTAPGACALPDLSLVERDAPDTAEHVHDDRVHCVYVLAGELELALAGERETVGPGTLACVPRGVPHAFSAPGDGPARVLELHAPGALSS